MLFYKAASVVACSSFFPCLCLVLVFCTARFRFLRQYGGGRLLLGSFACRFPFVGCSAASHHRLRLCCGSQCSTTSDLCSDSISQASFAALTPFPPDRAVTLAAEFAAEAIDTTELCCRRGVFPDFSSWCSASTTLL